MADAENLSQLEDVSTSEAFKVLNALVDNAEIPPEKADEAKTKYAKLHAALVQAMSREKSLLDEAKSLKRDCEAEEAKSKEGVSSAPESSIDALREDVEAALSEAALAQERQQLLQLEVTELQRQRNELALRMNELQEEHAAALAPLIMGLKTEVSTLRDEVAAERVKGEGARKEVDTAKERLSMVLSDIEELKSALDMEMSTLAKVEHKPDKARRQADLVAAALKNLQSQVESVGVKMGQLEINQKQLQGQTKDLQDEHSRMLQGLERGRIMIESKERHADDVRKDVELAGIEADKILADQVDIDMHIKNAVAMAKTESEMLARKQREKEVSLRQYKTAEVALKALQEALPQLRYSKEQLIKDKAALEQQTQRQAHTLAEIKKELDISMSSFLKEEAVGKNQSGLFQLSYAEVGQLEGEVVALREAEVMQMKAMSELSSQRDRVARLVSNQMTKVREAEMSGKVRHVELSELKKVRQETTQRIRDFEKLYDLVKNQRNKFINLIQAANQSISEMKDKLKILSNELDILRNESGSKEKLLGQSRSQAAASVVDRDQLRYELDKLGATFRDKQILVDEQLSQVDKLNAIITTTEREMLKLKKQYEIVIEARNYTGIMLIDRNDELCILYEKSNIQEEVLKQGELELKKRDDEARMLRLECAELQRAIDATRKMVPQIPMLDEDVARLQKSLLESRREAEALSLALENPDNKGRWRVLEGKIPDKDELSAKIQALEERLNDKKEGLLEKELILQEVTHLSDKLRLQAAEGRADTLELAKRVNDYQQRLRAITRKIMATVSELSMYQATALKLSAEKEELEEEVVAARERLAAGEAPTEDAEREWWRLERERLTLGDLALQKEEEIRILEAKGQLVDNSTALNRPNAYIPEQLGIPKPYGEFSPFKPSEPGTTMRHIRKPQPREIVL